MPHQTPRAPVAQLDRASDYGSGGWGFESSRARHSVSLPLRTGHIRPSAKSLSDTTALPQGGRNGPVQISPVDSARGQKWPRGRSFAAAAPSAVADRQEDAPSCPAPAPTPMHSRPRTSPSCARPGRPRADRRHRRRPVLRPPVRGRARRAPAVPRRHEPAEEQAAHAAGHRRLQARPPGGHRRRRQGHGRAPHRLRRRAGPRRRRPVPLVDPARGPGRRLHAGLQHGLGQGLRDARQCHDRRRRRSGQGPGGQGQGQGGAEATSAAA